MKMKIITTRPGFFSTGIVVRLNEILGTILKRSLGGLIGGLIGIAVLLLPAPCRGQGYTISTVAGGGSGPSYGDGGLATSAYLRGPSGVAVDAAGNIFIADTFNAVRKVAPSGMISTVAGSYQAAGYSGDGGAATKASLYSPAGLAVDGAGNLYIADLGNNRVRKVLPDGTITTVAGGGSPATSNGDGGPATNAKLSAPGSVAIDASGSIYISEGGFGASRIRKVSANGTISTIAGNGALSFSGDGGPATSAALNVPLGIALDAAGNLYIADGGNSRIRKVSASGIITTVAGKSTFSFSGDGGPATSAGLNAPTWVAVDSAGNLYITDAGNERVRMVNTTGIITTIAGNGVLGTSGDGGPATSARLNVPFGIALGTGGTVYVSEGGSGRVRMLTPSASSRPIAVTNAASFTGTTSVAAGEIITIFGTGIGPDSLTTLLLDSSGRVATSLASTRVLFDGIPGPLIYVSANQVSAVVPYKLTGSTTTKVQVEYQGSTSDPLTLAVADSVPGIFSIDSSGKGRGAILNQDYGVNSPTNPASAGSIISIYATGEGQTDPDGIDGQVAGDTLPKPRLPVSVKIGGVSANVLYAGAAPGAVAGLFQVNVKIPDTIQAGTAVPVSLTVGKDTSQSGITMAVSQPQPSVGLAGLTLSTNAVTGGTSVTGNTTLTGPAPSGGVVITLRSSGSAAVVPATVTVPAGQSSVVFAVTTSVITSIQTVTITATYAGVTQSAALTINVPAVTLASLSLSSSSVTGGTSVTGTVRLSGPAQTGGALVTLRTSGSAASVPSSVTVAVGLSSATFTITSSAVTSSQTITITAGFGSASQTATLTVNPPAQASPWTSGVYTLDGTLTVDGQTAHVQIVSAYVFSGYIGTVTSQPDVNKVAVAILFDKTATASGNTITYTGVDSAGSNYVNFSRSFNIEPIVSGTMTLTLSAARVGAAVNGTMNFTTTARTLTGTFTGTVLSID